jgi:hypothetical protein
VAAVLVNRDRCVPLFEEFLLAPSKGRFVNGVLKPQPFRD